VREKRKLGGPRPPLLLLKHIATLGPVGYLPLAPGTWGTLVSAVFVALLRPSAPIHAALILIFTFLGVYSAHHAEKAIGMNDPGHIVIDEFAGYLIASFFLPQTYGYIIASFILFRVFDVLKPPPINFFDRPGGLGIMADDIVAGIMANIVLQIWRAFA